jgi:hypothetical protein
MDVRHYTEVVILSLVGPVLMPPLLLPAEARNSGDLILLEDWSSLGVHLFSHIGSCCIDMVYFFIPACPFTSKPSKINH